MNKTGYLKHLLLHYGGIGLGVIFILLCVFCIIKLKDKPWLNNLLRLNPKRAPLIALLLMAIISFIVFRDYLLLKNAYLFWDINDDSYVSFYPRLYNLSHYVLTQGMPKWSFNVGMGQTIFPFVLNSPFDIIYLAGADHIPGLIVYVEVIKIICSGMLFFYYLRLLQLSDYTCITGSLLLAFCGFVTVGSPFLVFTSEVFNFVFLLLAFEMLFVKQKWMLFPLVICLSCISFPVDLYTNSLFLLLYAIFRHIQTGSFNGSKLMGLYLKMLGLGIIGVLLSGPFLLENLLQISNSPRGSGLTSFTRQLSATPLFQLADQLQVGTTIMRFFSNDIIGSNSNFKGWFDYVEAPTLYCGLCSLLLFPQVFKFLTPRVRILFILFSSLWLFPVLFPYFRYAFWLFAGDYYRLFSFFIAIVLLYYSLHALEYIFQKRKINVPLLLITTAVYILLLCFPPFIKRNLVDNASRTFDIITLISYACIFGLIERVKDLNYLKAAFLATLFFELCFSVNITANSRAIYSMQTLKSKSKIPFHDFSYNDYSLDAIRYIKASDSTFYRVDRTCDSSDVLNSSQIQGYNGTAIYSSFNQLYYVKYLQLMGVIDKSSETSSRWVQGLSNIPVLEIENNVKYFLESKNDTTHLSPAIWDLVATTGDVRIFKNKHTLPFGFTYNKFVKEEAVQSLAPAQRMGLTLDAAIVNKKDIGRIGGMMEYRPTNIVPVSVDSTFKDKLRELSKDTLVLTKFSNNHISGTITVNEDKIMYLSVPYDEEWTLAVDNKKEEKVLLNGGMTGVLLKKGSHIVSMDFELRFWQSGLLMSLCGLLIFAGAWYYQKFRRQATPRQAA